MVSRGHCFSRRRRGASPAPPSSDGVALHARQGRHRKSVSRRNDTTAPCWRSASASCRGAGSLPAATASPTTPVLARVVDDLNTKYRQSPRRPGRARWSPNRACEGFLPAQAPGPGRRCVTCAPLVWHPLCRDPRFGSISGWWLGRECRFGRLGSRPGAEPWHALGRPASHDRAECATRSDVGSAQGRENRSALPVPLLREEQWPLLGYRSSQHA